MFWNLWLARPIEISDQNDISRSIAALPQTQQFCSICVTHLAAEFNSAGFVSGTDAAELAIDA